MKNVCFMKTGCFAKARVLRWIHEREKNDSTLVTLPHDAMILDSGGRICPMATVWDIFPMNGALYKDFPTENNLCLSGI